MVAFLLVNGPNCHHSLVLASVVQGDTVNCNTCSASVKTSWIFELPTVSIDV